MESINNHTQSEILNAVRKAGGTCRIVSLAKQLGVSEETIRRNVKSLAREGGLEKVHGGVRLQVSAEESNFQSRMLECSDAKRKIAGVVSRMIEDDSSLFLDVGSTTAFIAEALKNHKRLTVITNSVAVAFKLATRNENRVFMAGGELRAHDGGAFGAAAGAFFENFETDYAILSAAAISARKGMMLFDLEEAEISRTVMQRSKCKIVAADSRKFTRSAPINVCDPSLIDILVSEKKPVAEIYRAAANWRAQVVVADEL
ncbi:Glycerol-3-phosphate regulon repressor [Pseudovibrio axinellae]|uniref:Glycerol-3-phosphate regulon repressor n=1 Tax=Pseudovibrio axinellae TaxID=989403 RepID=A0A166AJX6_9HYPH|nr:DeoR/GlpR family DNA-binding transcription regulator [Pseudovibrio axinellae]KZL21212.1 Glycerol-3-phosphate regulon repressor [Pseudovibrio axinellae]SEQ92165.1 transcriptional regulator, DeoR family [Pseudovibrio axinellae]